MEYIKLWARPWLKGSIRKETASFRGTFIDILAMAADSDYGDPGEIRMIRRADVGFTDEIISKILKISVEEWLIFKKCASEHSESKLKIEIVPQEVGFLIRVPSFPHYQSEYLRVKRWRIEQKKDDENLLFPDISGNVSLSVSSAVSNDTPSDELSNVSSPVSSVVSKVTDDASSSLPLLLSSLQNKNLKEELKRKKRIPIDAKFEVAARAGIKEIFEKHNIERLLIDAKFFDYLISLCWEFRELDLGDEFEGKIAHWHDHPPTKKSNLCLQFRNWFRIARKIHEDRNREALSRNVGRRKK